METIQQIRREDIELGDNVRRSMDDYETKCLAVSMRERGIEVPLELEPGTTKPYRLRDGFRRFAASGLAGLEMVPARIHPTRQSESERLAYQLTLNCQRADLAPLDRALSVQRLLEINGRHATDTARSLGMSSTAVSNLLSLLTLPEPIRQQLAIGKLAASTAYEIARVKDPQKQLELAGLAANGQLTRDAVSRAAKQRKPPRVVAAAVPRERFTARLGNGDSVTFAGVGLSLDRLVNWLDELSTQAKAALANGVELPAFIKSLKTKVKS